MTTSRDPLPSATPTTKDSTATLDLGPAVEVTSSIATGVADAQLGDRTPCTEATVGDLLDHLVGLTEAFTAAAHAAPLDGAPKADASNLAADWRDRLPSALADLAEAWRDPAAYDGMTAAGGVDMPGEVAAVVALNEVVVHGWDIARATGQPYEPDEDTLTACLAFGEQFSAPGTEEMRSGGFGPVVEVPADAPALDRLLGLMGRDPSWSPA